MDIYISTILHVLSRVLQITFEWVSAVVDAM